MNQKLLHELFSYVDGELLWKVRKGYTTKIGEIAGFQGKEYKQVGIDGKLYPCHRLIFLFHNGYLPQCIDHADGNKLNNRIENLREATRAENSQNCAISRNNKCGFKNVYWHKQRQKWNVLVQANGQRYDCGFYEDIELADLVAQEARIKYHKNFSRNI